MKRLEKIDYSDIPQITAEQMRRARRVTPEEHARFVRAYRNTFGKEPPLLRGRPPKLASELFKHVHMRVHPDVLERIKARAKTMGMRYQTLINQILMKHA